MEDYIKIEKIGEGEYLNDSQEKGLVILRVLIRSDLWEFISPLSFPRSQVRTEWCTREDTRKQTERWHSKKFVWRVRRREFLPQPSEKSHC